MENFQNFKKKYLDFTPLARGGQKQVYKAESSKYGNVVVKLYFNVGDPRSEREIDIGLNKNFNNVPKIFETGYLEIEGEKTLYIVEQRVNGELLRAKIQRNDYLNLKEAVIFLEQGLTFIEQLEKENIVHRDIKPENIIVDNNGIVYFLDFGIARVLGQPSLTQTEAMFGPHTPGYAAPEQFNNLKSNIDSRTDLFSIGVVTYECITERVIIPFAKELEMRWKCFREQRL
ncbi:serine/threonine-protein kinase [Christensenella minuta]|uniref:Protein kinase domain-containing protein n=1 Tax=Christensenella minuta TaxID=626937 RepID=A0A136Q448_9FIRM|nr:serine/threonine-protein kinase [Christensenella minuta]KXK65439.1 hypothetical protein HMPREF3293_01651 [Christensenella minuta]